MELEVTWKMATKVWWAFFWRNIIAVICAMIIGGIASGIIGVILAILGFSEETVLLIVTPLGFILGIVISIVPIKLILGKNFGDFRLVSIENT
jgi:hypothetical protein